MTIRTPKWSPDLSNKSGAKYKVIADALADDIQAGRLAVGDKLPAHRELSWHLGVTVGTITRAYQEAERRGLAVGEIGRGTFIANTNITADSGRNAVISHPYACMPLEDDPNAPIQLDVNHPPSCGQAEAMQSAMQHILNDPEMARFLTYQNNSGMPHHREAAAKWIKPRYTIATAENTLITSGGQHSCFVALSAVTRPGDTIVAESMSHTGIKSIARNLGIKLHGIIQDEEGLCAEAFEEYCHAHRPAALYTVCTPNNPTNIVMSVKRRKAIAEIAITYNVKIVEDDIFATLLPDPPPLLISFAPEIGIFASSISKTLSPGLRVGFIAGPKNLIPAMEGAIRATCGMASPMTTEVFSHWVETGIADNIIQQQQEETEARQKLFKERFDPLEAKYTLPKGALHAWLDIPAPIMAADYVMSALRRNVQIGTSGPFVIDKGRHIPQSVRICLGSPRQQETLIIALDQLAALYEDGSAGTDVDIY